jgi:hypothetical protein
LSGLKQRQFLTWSVVASLAMAGTGCSVPSLSDLTPGKAPEVPVLEPGVFPTNYKGEILNFLRPTLTTRVRDAYVAQPVLRPLEKVPQYVTCVRYSPLDGKNQPTGSETKLAIFLGGRLMQYLPGDPQVCAGLNYQRFPELESLAPPKT